MDDSAMHSVFEGMTSGLKRLGDEHWRNELLVVAERYLQKRVLWLVADRQSRQEIDPQRKVAHDAWIDMCNQLSRRMAEMNIDLSWRRDLGLATHGEDRRRIGDFACYVAYRLACTAR